jgi:hypothetical protein
MHGPLTPGSTHLYRFLRIPFFACALIVAFGFWGCASESRKVGQRVRDLAVRTVEDQGLTLDEQADPRDVVYVFLRAVYDDYAAGDNRDAREAAFDRQLNLCAVDYIASRAFRQSLGRNKSVQQIVWRWAPIVGHYREDFPKDVAIARTRMVADRIETVTISGSDYEVTRVLLELASPDGDPNASVVAQFQLVREQGYWRIGQVGFVKSIRHITDDLRQRMSRRVGGAGGTNG